MGNNKLISSSIVALLLACHAFGGDTSNHAGGGGTCPSPTISNPNPVCTPSGSSATGDGGGSSSGGGNTGNVGSLSGAATSGITRKRKPPMPTRPVAGVPWLVNFQHNIKQCTAAGGTVTDVTITTVIGVGEAAIDVDSVVQICKFASNACPSGWAKYKNFTTTTANTCTGQDLSAGACSTAPVSCTTGSHAFGNNYTEACTYKNVNKCQGGLFNALPASNKGATSSLRADHKVKKPNRLFARLKKYSSNFSKYISDAIIPELHAVPNVDCSCTNPDGFGSGWSIETDSGNPSLFKGACSGVAMKSGTAFTSNGRPFACIDPNVLWSSIPSTCKTAMTIPSPGTPPANNPNVYGGWAAGCGYAGSGDLRNDAGWTEAGQCCDVYPPNPGTTCDQQKCLDNSCPDLWNDNNYLTAWNDTNDTDNDGYPNAVETFCSVPSNYTSSAGTGSCHTIATCNAAPPANCCLYSKGCLATVTNIGCY